MLPGTYLVSASGLLAAVKHVRERRTTIRFSETANQALNTKRWAEKKKPIFQDGGKER
jgi:hypothetical protein